ncbi:hypothetical protein V499_00281 [Pseudogymnoascus sp. VKM F-103]|nr:hypothetical protein V499_00281 [Pseudogymnoascus sp. VKM F-103]
MDTLCVIPYTYIPHKPRRKEHDARSRVQTGTTCYSTHLEGGNDFSRASEIRQTTPNIHNLGNEIQVRELAMDDTPKFPDLNDSAIHGSFTGNQARPIDLENEVNNSRNVISETTHDRAAEHGIDENSPVAPESRGHDDGTDQEPASKEVSTLNSVGSPICSPHGLDVITFSGSPLSQDGGDSTLAGEPEISSRDGFSKPDEEHRHENESEPEGCTVIVDCDEARRGMQPCTLTRGDNAMRKLSLAATRDGAENTEGLRYSKRKRASIVDKTAHQSQSKRQRLSPPDSENDSSSEDDDEDDADYELNETRNDDGYVSSASSACDSEERPVQAVCGEDIVNPEMLIPIYIPQKYLRYLALQQSMHSATARVKSRHLKRKSASAKATGTRYTEDDDKQLLELREERGMSWQEIQREYFPQREINSLQVHFCTKVNPKRRKDHILHA